MRHAFASADHTLVAPPSAAAASAIYSMALYGLQGEIREIWREWLRERRVK